MLYTVGDTHGNQYKWVEQIEPILSPSDIILICGDFGVGFWNGRYWSEETFYDFLSEQEYTVLFIDGNHENFEALNEYPVEKWHGGKVHFICDDIIHLMRGQVYTIGTQTFFTFGGAHSVDWFQRTEGISWWKEEIPNHLEMQEGQDNLMKMNHKVDYIITHTAPYEVLAEMGMDISDEEEVFSLYLDHIRKIVDFKDWYFGHLHFDEELDNFHCVFENVVELKEN